MSTISNVTRDVILATNVKLANTFWLRFKGLLGTDKLAENEGLLISPCKQVHTHFMQYDIDVLFLDKEMRVLHMIPEMQPWKMSPLIKGAFFVLELPARAASGLTLGDQLKLLS